MNRAFTAVLVLAFCACPLESTDDGGRRDGGGGSGGSAGSGGAFNIVSLDSDAKEPSYLAIAVDAVQERIGVAYYSRLTGQSMVGVDDYALRYVEWKQGTISPVETIRGGSIDAGIRGPVQQPIGVGLAFNPTSGEPSIAFRGGPSAFRMGDSIFWFQSDAVVAHRNAGAWTQVTVAATGDETNCGNPVSDRGLLVGLWPAIVYESSGNMVVAWRDGHDGQFEMQDWQGSDVEVAAGPPNGPFTRTCVKEGGNNKEAWGGRINMVMANGQPAMVYDQTRSGADAIGQNAILQRRNANGSWTAPFFVYNTTNVQSGGSLAWNAVEGYGVAVQDRPVGKLIYKQSTDGLTWSTDEVFGLGSGGWYPSLAMDPIYNEPAIAHYICSARSNVNEGSCPAAEDELRVTQRTAGNWLEVLVDPAGGINPKLGFFASGKRIIVYRDPQSGALKLAVEK